MELTELIIKYGLPFVTIALIVVVMVGIVKIFTKGIVNVKQVSETKKKWFSKMYMGLALVFSYGLMLAYYGLILKQPIWAIEPLRDAGIVWTITTPLYELYKQFGGRKLLVMFVGAIQKLFKGKNKNADDLLDVIMNVLTQDAPYLTEAQKETIKSDLTIAINGKTEE